MGDLDYSPHPNNNIDDVLQVHDEHKKDAEDNKEKRPETLSIIKSKNRDIDSPASHISGVS